MVVDSYCSPAEGRFRDGCSWSGGMHVLSKALHIRHKCYYSQLTLQAGVHE